jgi:hypothetical protein
VGSIKEEGGAKVVTTKGGDTKTYDEVLLLATLTLRLTLPL